MRGHATLFAVVTAAALAGAVNGCGSDTSQAPEKPTWEDCQAGDAAFVRKTIVALLGRRPLSGDEVRLYSDMMAQARNAGGSESDARALVARTLMSDDAFRLRWANFIMDSLGVRRTEFFIDSGYHQNDFRSCFGGSLTMPTDKGELAAYVRDNSPSGSQAPIPKFTMGQLINSAISLDDISPIYRANLFQLLLFPLPGANVSPTDLEVARREDIAGTFGDVYLHRDPECLLCHNSESSVTATTDPATNHWYPLSGYFEKSLYGSSTATTKEPLQYASVFRLRDVSDAGGPSPWGWDGSLCGRFNVPTKIDPLDVQAYFGSIHSSASDPSLGLRASIWSVEESLHHGFEELARAGLQLHGSDVADPDQAFAYLVAANFAEKVWTEVVGTPLTIANYFPRSAVQRDTLQALVTHFVQTRFSLKTLLLDVVTNPAYNLAAPDDACWQQPYAAPTIFNPFSMDSTNAAERGNSPGDAVHPLSGRVLLHSLHTAMEWKPVDDFLSDSASIEEIDLQQNIGVFLSRAEPGSSGLDFQARLAWEDRYGSCAPNGSPDFIQRLVDLAGKTPGATFRDAVITLKDRLMSEPTVDDAEAPLLEALASVKLTDGDASHFEAGLRRVCGALVSTPAFMLSGVPSPDTPPTLKLVLPEYTYKTLCQQAAGVVPTTGAGYHLTCSDESSTLSRAQ